VIGVGQEPYGMTLMAGSVGSSGFAGRLTR
jgi:hypothetical protein